MVDHPSSERTEGRDRPESRPSSTHERQRLLTSTEGNSAGNNIDPRSLPKALYAFWRQANKLAHQMKIQATAECGKPEDYSPQEIDKYGPKLTDSEYMHLGQVSRRLLRSATVDEVKVEKIYRLTEPEDRKALEEVIHESIYSAASREEREQTLLAWKEKLGASLLSKPERLVQLATVDEVKVEKIYRLTEPEDREALVKVIHESIYSAASREEREQALSDWQEKLKVGAISLDPLHSDSESELYSSDEEKCEISDDESFALIRKDLTYGFIPTPNQPNIETVPNNPEQYRNNLVLNRGYQPGPAKFLDSFSLRRQQTEELVRIRNIQELMKSFEESLREQSITDAKIAEDTAEILYSERIEGIMKKMEELAEFKTQMTFADFAKYKYPKVTKDTDSPESTKGTDDSPESTKDIDSPESTKGTDDSPESTKDIDSPEPTKDTDDSPEPTKDDKIRAYNEYKQQFKKLNYKYTYYEARLEALIAEQNKHEVDIRKNLSSNRDRTLNMIFQKLTQTLKSTADKSGKSGNIIQTTSNIVRTIFQAAIARKFLTE